MKEVRSYSLEYCSVDHNSGRFSKTLLVPSFPVTTSGPAAFLAPPSRRAVPPGPASGLSWKRSSSCDVFMESRLEFSLVITVLAMFSLNFWRLCVHMN